ncbi:MAG TPA: CerR family C-terminal domain-containing protein [Gemmatimonadales bacterium]|nr:CerR family C-terminal domain-containing protein [Gemmatimonadales bacterium]
MADAQAQILDAAEALFARQGFAATTIKAIGHQAAVNPALLYYYFPDKAQLYHAVLERRLATAAREVAQKLRPDAPAPEAIAQAIRAYATLMRQTPYLPRLIARELADHEAAHALPLIREIAAGLFQRLCEVIRRGQDRGELRADLAPQFAAISTIAQVAWFFVAQPAVSRLLGFDGAVPADEIERYTEHVIRYAMAALTPDARRPTRARKRARR